MDIVIYTVGVDEYNIRISVIYHSYGLNQDSFNRGHMTTPNVLTLVMLLYPKFGLGQVQLR